MKGERIRLLLVILPENTGCHGMLVILFWSDSPLTFLVCLVTLAYNYLVWVSWSGWARSYGTTSVNIPNNFYWCWPLTSRLFRIYCICTISLLVPFTSVILFLSGLAWPCCNITLMFREQFSKIIKHLVGIHILLASCRWQRQWTGQKPLSIQRESLINHLVHSFQIC